MFVLLNHSPTSVNILKGRSGLETTFLVFENVGNEIIYHYDENLFLTQSAYIFAMYFLKNKVHSIE